MRRAIAIVISALVATFFFVPTAVAGSPHFVGTISIDRDGNTLTISGKEAGLGNETQVHIEVSADAQCVNPGSKHPQAANKESFSTGGDFPVQNGKAIFSLSLTASFQPSCSPPMTVVFTNVVVSDTEHGVTETFPGPY